MVPKKSKIRHCRTVLRLPIWTIPSPQWPKICRAHDLTIVNVAFFVVASREASTGRLLGNCCSPLRLPPPLVQTISCDFGRSLRTHGLPGHAIFGGVSYDEKWHMAQ